MYVAVKAPLTKCAAKDKPHVSFLLDFVFYLLDELLCGSSDHYYFRISYWITRYVKRGGLSPTFSLTKPRALIFHSISQALIRPLLLVLRVWPRSCRHSSIVTSCLETAKNPRLMLLHCDGYFCSQLYLVLWGT